jgi:methyl-accepting chemotaxis protein
MNTDGSVGSVGASDNRAQKPRNKDSSKSRWTIGISINALNLLLALMMFGISGFSLYRIGSIKAVSDKIFSDAMPSLALSLEINNLLGKAHACLLQMLLVESSEERKALQDKLEQYAVKMKEYLFEYEKMVDNEKERDLLNVVKTCRETYISNRKTVNALIESNMVEAKKLSFSELEPARIAYGTALDALVVFNQKDSEESTKVIDREVRKTKYLILIVGIFSFITGTVISLLIVRRVNAKLLKVVGQVFSGADQIVAASSQVSVSSQSLAKGASEQAASLEETSSSLEQLSSTTKSNAENAKQAKLLADDTNDAASAGAKCVLDMSKAMDNIQTSSDQMRNAMSAVRESNNEVAKIIKTIDEIAFQTNILALNAAVEAARAGEAGMGFAVVAYDVPILAQKSAAAAQETTSRIRTAIELTEAGVRVSDKVVDDLVVIHKQSKQVEASLKGIEQKSRQVDLLVGEIATASIEQSQGIEQVNVAVSQMGKVTQTTAANAEESASAAEELNAQAAATKESVKELLQLVGGKHV